MIEYPPFVALNSTRRGINSNGVKINSRRGNPIFLHMLIECKNGLPRNIYVNDINLALDSSGWAKNPEFFDRGASLVYAETLDSGIPFDLLKKSFNYRHSLYQRDKNYYLYIRLEWRRFWGGLPTIAIDVNNYL